MYRGILVTQSVINKTLHLMTNHIDHRVVYAELEPINLLLFQLIYQRTVVLP
jgi:hypothetical protein